MIKEGTYRARPVKATSGANKKMEPVVTVRFQLSDGPDKGQCINWNGQVTEKSARFTLRGLKALGWKGVDVRHAPREILDANIEVPVTITHFVPKDENGNPDHNKAFASVRSVGIMEMPELNPLADSEAISATRMLLASADVERHQEDEIPF